MKPSIAVIGTVFVDYKGFAGVGYRADGRNLGQVKTVAGGVARNVAVNLACLEMPTWFVSTLNNDDAGSQLTQDMHIQGVSLNYLRRVPAGGTGCWLAILDHNGSLLGSVSQMPDMAVMEREIAPVLTEVLAKVQGIALEIDLSLPLILRIIEEAQKADCKIYALPGNLSLIGEHFELFRQMACFICNETEAQILMGIQSFDEHETAIEQMRIFTQAHGLKNLVVTLGEKGALYIDQDGVTGHQAVISTEVVDCTGAGDAFFSGTVAALSHNRTLAQAVATGAKIASMVVSAEHSDCSVLSEQLKADLISISEPAVQT